MSLTDFGQNYYYSDWYLVLLYESYEWITFLKFRLGHLLSVFVEKFSNLGIKLMECHGLRRIVSSDVPYVHADKQGPGEVSYLIGRV